jgi:hypothetical protein
MSQSTQRPLAASADCPRRLRPVGPLSPNWPAMHPRRQSALTGLHGAISTADAGSDIRFGTADTTPGIVAVSPAVTKLAGLEERGSPELANPVTRGVNAAGVSPCGWQGVAGQVLGRRRKCSVSGKIPFVE